MHVAHSAEELRVEGPCLVDRYLEGALELDVDALCDGEGAWVAAVLEHVEPTGVHSGDSACVLPGPSVSAALEDEIREVATRLAAGLGARGLMNLQLALAGGKALGARGEPARVADGAVRRQGDRRAPRRARRPAAARRASRRARAARSGRVPSRAWAKEAVFPAERFAGAAVARARDEVDRRGDGGRGSVSRPTGARSAPRAGRAAAARWPGRSRPAGEPARALN